MPEKLLYEPQTRSNESRVDVLTGSLLDGEDRSTTIPTIPSELIPDFEFIKFLNRGAYGCVWLVRNKALNTLRALKVVHRAMFTKRASFNREMEGIKRYGDHSTRHPGLIQVLHVGARREIKEGFYYYVMPLADDLCGLPCKDDGTEEGCVAPGNYVPHTLNAEIKRDLRVSLDRCFELGIHLAGALHELHEEGLCHCDVKPHNIIFIDQDPKLADVGLVDDGKPQHGGTEGYTPDEGAGTRSADVFSLGRLLYRSATGNQADEYPSIPDAFFTDVANNRAARKRWHQLQPIIAKACHENPGERYQSASAIQRDLQRAYEPRPWPILPMAAIFCIAALAGTLAIELSNPEVNATDTANQDGPNLSDMTELTATKEINDDGITMVKATSGKGMEFEMPMKFSKGLLTVNTTPPGAIVYVDDREMGTTPFREKILAGDHNLRIEKERHKPFKKEISIENNGRLKLDPQLEFFDVPEPGQLWTNSLGMMFTSAGDRHIAEFPITRELFERYCAETGSEIESTVIPLTKLDQYNRREDDKHIEIVVLIKDDAEAFGKWLGDREKRLGYLLPEQHYTMIPMKFAHEGESVEPENVKGKRGFIASVVRESFGEVFVEMKKNLPGMPPELFLEGSLVGTAGRSLKLPTGKIENLEIRKIGYDTGVIKVNVLDFGEKTVEVDMNAWDGFNINGSNLENDLGMKFVEHKGILWSIYEARISEMAAFYKEKGLDFAPLLATHQTPEHPVAVSFNDALAFCKWLTQRYLRGPEWKEDYEFRLPYDLEWSDASDTRIDGDEGLTPDQRSTRSGKLETFLWRTSEATPPAGYGNFRGVETGRPTKLEGYDDGFSKTAPVGSFQPNRNGLYDLHGNLGEYMIDPYNDTSKFLTVRGASYAAQEAEDLAFGMRKAVPERYREGVDPITGFRVVIARKRPDDS